jgi:hypothetical protein
MFALTEGNWKGPFLDDGKFLFVKRTGSKNDDYRPFEECSEEISRMLRTLSWNNHRSRLIESIRFPRRIFFERLMIPSLSISTR